MSTGIPTIVILTIIFLAGHALGSFFSLYEQIFWFDMVMHTLGGAWLAAVFVTVGDSRFPSFLRELPRFRYTLRVVLLVLIAGLAWELYQHVFAVWATARFGDLGFAQPLSDTLSDLLLDAVGAVIAALLLFRKSGSETSTK